MPTEANPANFLEIINVTKRFGNFVALKEVSFSLQQGEIMGIIGPNGAGKTMLVNMIAGNIPYSSGDIRFLGQSLRGLKPYQISQLGISWTSQVVQPITDMTTLENVMVGALFGKKGGERKVWAARKKAEATLELLGLTDQKDVPGENLNIQERKRLERARALAMVPKLLLLDEVLAGLNQTEIEEGVNLLKRIQEAGVTLIVIEHVMKVIAKLSTRLLVLHHGEKISEGSVDQVMNDKQVIEAYLGKRQRMFTKPG